MRLGQTTGCSTKPRSPRLSTRLSNEWHLVVDRTVSFPCDCRRAWIPCFIPQLSPRARTSPRTALAAVANLCGQSDIIGDLLSPVNIVAITRLHGTATEPRSRAAVFAPIKPNPDRNYVPAEKSPVLFGNNSIVLGFLDGETRFRVQGAQRGE